MIVIGKKKGKNKDKPHFVIKMTATIDDLKEEYTFDVYADSMEQAMEKIDKIFKEHGFRLEEQ